MKILKEAFTIPDNVVMFYDRHLRLWTLYIKDEEGNQISNTEYTPSKADAIEMAQDIDNFVIRESLKENNMKIQEWYTGEPSSLEYGRAIDAGRKKLKDKYEPFEVDLWYGDGLNSTGWKVQLQSQSGHYYQWIAQVPRTTWGPKDLTLYGPIDLDFEKRVRTVFDLAEYKDREIGTFKSIEQMMSYIFQNFSHLEDDLDESWQPVEFDETTGEYYSRPGNEFDGIDPQTQNLEEDTEEKKRYPLYMWKAIEDAVANISEIPEEHKEAFISLIGDRATVKKIPRIGYKSALLPKSIAKKYDATNYNSLITSPDYYDTTIEEVLIDIYNEMKNKWFRPQKESINEGLQYIENINSRKGIRAPKTLTETYHINDEEVMNKVAELGKELESQGFKYVNSKDSRDYYDFYRKIEDGKGIWKAVIYNYGAAEIIDVTYEQARGIKPIDSLEQLRKDLGKILLPNDSINEALGRDYSHIPEVKQINYSNNKNGNLLPYLDCNAFKAALEETGLEAFKIKSARLRNISLADLRDEFGGRGMQPWKWTHDFDSSIPMGDGNEFEIFWKGEFPKVEEKLQNEKEGASEEKDNAKLIEEVEVPTLEGPNEGAEYGLSELINAAIQHELETVNEYNVLALNARAEGYDDIASVIDEINTEENKHIGQLQELLKTISPNAQAIVAGETEASDDLVSIQESFDKIPVITFKGKRTFDTEEEAWEFKKSLGDKYRAIHKVEYPDMTFYIVDFEED